MHLRIFDCGQCLFGKKNKNESKGSTNRQKGWTKYFQTNRCLCAENFFSSIPLSKELWANGIEYIGSLRANKIEIPISFLKNKARTIETTLFGFNKEITNAFFVPIKDKAVILVSTINKEINVETK